MSRRAHRARPSVLMTTALALAAGVLVAAPTSAQAQPAPAAAAAAGAVAPTASSVAVPRSAKPDPKVTKERVGMSVQPSLARVGVAYPLIVTFPQAVKRRGAVERRLVVTVDGKPIEGAWSWRSSDAVTYRPKGGFWPAKSRVKLTSTLAGTVLARNGAAKRQLVVASKKTTRVVSFRVARSFVSYVDGRTDRFVVKKNGKKIKTMLTSLGKPGYATRSGIKVATDKYLTRRMTSTEAGITNEYYDVTATYAVRITPTGEFVHGAPWAHDGRFGNFNASHGCTNLTTADAKWFYDRVIPGDPVITTGTGRAMEWTNGLGGPWNVPWKDWLAKSALQ